MLLSRLIVEIVAYLALETAVGAAYVCAEAEALHVDEQAAVAVVATSRAARAGTSPILELRRAGQFAPRPCGPGRMTAEHVGSWLRGRWLGRPHWSRQAVSFCAHGAARKVGDRWRRRGLVDYRRGDGHVYWRRRLNKRATIK